MSSFPVSSLKKSRFLVYILTNLYLPPFFTVLRMGRYRKERNMLVDQVRSLGAVPVEVAGMEGSKGGRVLGGARKKQ